jgi:stage IV sporulation protein FB
LGWQDRQFEYGGPDGGGIGGWFRRVFANGENPLTWAFPIYKVWGITVKIHIFFVIFVVAMLIRSLAPAQAGFVSTLLMMAGLFGIVLLHEYGHCFACRRVQGEADEIMLWPLGGLASCNPPHRWQAHLVTVVGGPMVNVILWPILGLGVWGLTGSWGDVFFNPFQPLEVLSGLTFRSGATSYLLDAAWWLYFLNLILLAFNVLLPMYPMDGGRIVQALLWRKMGYHRSMQLATTLGLVMAVVVAVAAMLFGQVMIMGIALFGGITCWVQQQQLKFMGDPAMAGYDSDRGFAGMPDDPGPKEPGKRQKKQAERRAQHEAEIDRILEKISRDGMGSLTAKEKKLLSKDTAAKRGR